eukprot:6212226-Pleurochrysis_carterae.AAC.4
MKLSLQFVTACAKAMQYRWRARRRSNGGLLLRGAFGGPNAASLSTSTHASSESANPNSLWVLLLARESAHYH